MLRTQLRAAMLATTVAAAVIAPAAAASAASTTVSDPQGDVWESTYDADTQTETFTKADSVTNVDLVSSTVSHGARRVNVKMQYTDLKKTGATYYSIVYLRFDNGPQRVAAIDTSAGWGGKHVLFKNGKNSNGPVACSGFTHAIDYQANTVTMSIPRGCLGTPRWIESSVLASGSLDDGTTTHYYLDNGATAGHAYLKWGKRLRRG